MNGRVTHLESQATQRSSKHFRHSKKMSKVSFRNKARRVISISIEERKVMFVLLVVYVAIGFLRG